MSSATSQEPVEIELFYDGGCPLCKREVAMLQRWDRRHKIIFTDIDAADFRPENVGKTHDQLMAEIHGRLPDGTWLTGVEVFRRVYAATGWKTLAAVTRLPPLSWMLYAGYAVFAKQRLRLTGRCDAKGCAVKPRSAS